MQAVWYLAAYQAPAGRILVTDEETVYGFGRVPSRFSGTPNTYHLFACGKTPRLTDPKRPPRQAGLDNLRQGRSHPAHL